MLQKASIRLIDRLVRAEVLAAAAQPMDVFATLRASARAARARTVLFIDRRNPALDKFDVLSNYGRL